MSVALVMKVYIFAKGQQHLIIHPIVAHGTENYIPTRI